jgi:rhodanese-related sulfurtransferase
MAKEHDILAAAAQRGREFGLPYAGALLPVEAHALLEHGAVLVDVRTRAELEFVGRVAGSVDIEWNTYPGGQRNPEFLRELTAALPQDAIVMFICRSGARSHGAALVAAQAGYARAYNVLEGFEGDRDQHGHRSSVGGWRAAGLPWIQG